MVGKQTKFQRRASASAAAALALIGCSLLLSSDNGESSGRLRLSRTRRLAEGWTGPFRHIYFCGTPPAIAAALFPEFDPRTSSWSSLSKGPMPTKDDLLIAAYANAEVSCARKKPELSGRILHFPGKMMFFNHEAADTQGGPRPLDATKLGDACASLKGEKICLELQGTVASQVAEFEKPGGRFNYLPPSDRAYVFGPHPDSPRSIRLPYAAQEWLYQDLEAMRWMWDHDRKPVNAGGHFAVFLASHCVPFRDAAVKRIAQLGEVHVGDEYMRLCVDAAPDPPRGPKPRLSPQPDHTTRDDWGDNDRIMHNYKFSIVMENTYREGYITEKIGNAFKSGAVPIWYGGKDALDIYNPEAFIYYDVEDPRPALNRIRYLLKNPDAYEKVLTAPILKDGNRTVEKYFSLRDDIGGGQLKNRIRRLIGVDEDLDVHQVEVDMS